MVIDYRALGMRLKKERKFKKLTQEDIAEALDISVSYISRVERGVVKVSLETLVKISLILNVSTGYLIDGTIKREENYLKGELKEITQSFGAGKMELLTKIARSIDEFDVQLEQIEDDERDEK